MLSPSASVPAPIPMQPCVCVWPRYIHSRGFAHCDISIENVLCATGPLPGDPDGWRCFVIDFGQAVQTDGEGRCRDLATRSPTLKVLYQVGGPTPSPPCSASIPLRCV
jgi:hypothetical protein